MKELLLKHLRAIVEDAEIYTGRHCNHYKVEESLIDAARETITKIDLDSNL